MGLYHTKGYTVEKGSVRNPCTKRPVPCQICLSTTGSVRQYVGSYHYLDHMHPSQTLTEEEVLKYALRKEEYVGVLGKEYAAKDQERRLAMELNSDATNPALFWSKVVLVQDR